jgi:repressor LexA
MIMLTEKQQNVLDSITEFISKYGKSPTIEELKDILRQKSKRGVTQYLEALEKKGFITRGY